MTKLNRNALKYIAASAMLIDHIGMFFVPVSTPLGCVMRVIGRLTAPIMCMFLAEGYIYTSSKIKYGLRLFVFAVISQFAYVFSHNFSLLTAEFNMIFTLFLCFIILLAYDKIKNEILKFIIITVCVAVSYFSDWGVIAPLWVLGFYQYHDNKEKQTLVFSVVSVVHILFCVFSCVKNGFSWYCKLWQLGLFLFIPFIYLYSGENGKNSVFSKWFFYFFYPLHLVILECIERFVI